MSEHKELKVVMRGKRAYGVRNEDGYICFMWEPHRYPGQEGRYETELQETVDQANLIASAPDMYKALKELFVATGEGRWLNTYRIGIKDKIEQAIAKAEGNPQ